MAPLLVAQTLHPGSLPHFEQACGGPCGESSFDAAADGDTVVIPEGTCTWTEGYELCKSVVIRGAGIDRTIPIDGTPASDRPVEIPFLIRGCTDKAVRVPQMTFRDQDASDSPGTILVNGDGLGFRFDHVKFDERVPAPAGAGRSVSRPSG